jgi:hypothetical protein
MTDRIDPTTWPTPRGPWPEVEDPSRIYDHGRPWCINATGHPGEGGYPDPQAHVPWGECHGPDITLTEIRDHLGGDLLDLSVFVAAPFRFGEPRRLVDNTARLVLEAATESSETPSIRFSLGLGEALRLARAINHLVDEVTMPARAGVAR